MTTTGGPFPWSNIILRGTSSPGPPYTRARGGPTPRSARVARSLRSLAIEPIQLSIPQRFAGLEGMGDPFLRFSLAAQAEEGLALQIQQVLLALGGRRRSIQTGQNPGELAADQRIVLADPSSAPGEVDAELQRREGVRAANRDRSRLRWHIASHQR